MSHLVRSAALAALLLCSTAGLAPAQTGATAEGAAAIRTGLKDWIAAWLGGSDGAVRLAFAGPIAVAPEGPAYAVKIPASTATIVDEAGATQGVVHVGAIEVRLTPEPDALWSVEWRVPSAITADDGRGETVDITIGGQSGRGVYSTALGTFTDLDLRLTDVAAAPETVRETHGGRIDIDEVLVRLDGREGPGGLWDVDGEAGLRGLSYREYSEYSDSTVTIAALEGHLSATGLDVPALIAFMQGVARLEAPLGGVADVMDTTPKLLDTVEAGWSMSGWATRDTPRDGGLPPSTDSVGQAGAAVAIAGIREETATAQVTATLAGLDFGDAPDGDAEVTPRLINVDVTLEDVPSEIMTGALKEFLRGAFTLGPDAALEMAGMQIAAALNETEGVVRIDQILVDFRRVGLDLSGRIWAADNMFLGFAGDTVLMIGGYKALYELMDAAWGPDEQSRQFLTALELIGQPAVDDQGRPGRRYDVVIDEKSGAVTFNGTNVETLFP